MNNLPVACQNMFSVEQVEYVRRIRSSGLSREQVLAIWERLDRIDAEFNQQVLSQFSTSSATNPAPTSSPQISREFMQLLQQERNQQANALIMMQMQQILSSASSSNGSKPANLVLKTQQLTSTDSQAIENDVKAAICGVEEIQSSVKSAPLEPTSNSDSIPARLVDESDPELAEFLRKNAEPSICEQIRQFIALNGIKQHQVAVLVGTSQSYISKYLKADYLEMSERSRRNIYRWYVTYRNQPQRAISDACAVIANPQLQQSVSSSLPLTVPLSVNSNNGSNMLPMYPIAPNEAALSPNFAVNAPASPRSTSSSSGGNHQQTQSGSQNMSIGQVHSSHRRFRFTFRSQQLAILERAFSEDTYPTVERREDLAKQLSLGLDSDQAVSLFTVTNWFANRRKEAKRAAVEEGINVEELGMKRGRGRPSILHRMASAQLRETRQISTAGANEGPLNGNNSNELHQTRAKRTRKSTDEPEDGVAISDCDDDCSMSSTGGDVPDDNFQQNATDLSVVFPAPEVIAS